MKKLLFLASLFLPFLTNGQKNSERPRLVVGIVVDQMRQEYLYRFNAKFGDGGFKRLMNNGFVLKNAHYNYVPTYTGPGHASVYTGSTPAIHGIIGNDWYDKETRKPVNCVSDDRQKPVGADPQAKGISPWRMLSTTITDELKVSTQMRSKVIGISIKDRGAVLPAGHSADGAFWFNSKFGQFVSSSYYGPELPAWVKKFNSLGLADKYLSQEWKTIFPMSLYTESGPDDSPYETIPRGKDKPVFPYNLGEIKKTAGYELMATTPFGDDLLTDLAKAAIEGEELGKDETPDFLTVSYSCPDIVGHRMGPQSIEVEDVYIRLDRNIQDLLNELDKKVGAGKYSVFLTADHGVGEVPQYMLDNGLPGNYFKTEDVETGLNTLLAKYFPGRRMIEDISNDQIFLSHEAFTADVKTGSIDYLIASELISKYLMATPGVAQVYTENVLHQGDYGERGIKGMIIRGYSPKRSGDIAFALEPGWMESGPTGTTHGSAYSYDTHIPVLFFGAGIKKGSSTVYHTITDIAPTMSVILGTKFPSGCTGQPVSELLD